MNKPKYQWIRRVFDSQISIKTLTLLGFSLVALPLVFAFLYSTHQVNNLSRQGTAAILNVADLVDSNRAISQIQAKVERFASQYAVLKETDLLINFQQQAQLLTATTQGRLQPFTDPMLLELSEQYLQQLTIINRLITQPIEPLKLEQVQGEFRQLSQYYQQLAVRTNELVNSQAQDIKRSTANIEQAMSLSLLSIPIALTIAVFFIILIVKPLKGLQPQIKQLARGKFQSPIELKGSTEMVEIADALEFMRSRLLELELQKSSFIRHISHELKTPLAAIREGTELIYDNSVGELNQAQKEITDIIRTSVYRLQRLIEDLLDFNIVLDSTSLQDAQLFDVEKLLNDTIELRRLDLNRKKLQVDVSTLPIKLYSNKRQLEVVIDNLLSNAIKFSPASSVIKVETLKEHDDLLLRITDQGPGIPKNAFDDIFSAFYQGKSDHNSPIKSSGLGLTIVKELLMRLNGNITLISETEAPSFTQFLSLIHI